MQEKQLRLRDDTSRIWDWHRGDTLPDLLPPSSSEQSEQQEFPLEPEATK